LFLLQAVQKEREENLSRFLKDFLSQYVHGDKEGFISRAESEAKRLSDAGTVFSPSFFFFYFYISSHSELKSYE